MNAMSLFADVDESQFAERRENYVDMSGTAFMNMAVRTIDDLGMARLAGEVVQGLDYMPNIISIDEERELLRWIDSSLWSTHWQRRTQFYGKRYLPDGSTEAESSVRMALDRSFTDSHLPWWVMWLRERLVNLEVFDRLPNQMGVNEYLPGQGIAPHVDYHRGTVVSITLGTGCLMDFTEVDGTGDVSTWLSVRSLVILKGPARYQWKHGIARRKRDIVNGIAIPRGRRVSVTFRQVIPSQER